MRKIFFVFMLLVSLSMQAIEIINFNEGWRFYLGDVEGAEKSYFNDSSWRVLDVPHDWSIEGEYDKDNATGAECGYLPAGIGWYRKTIKVPEKWKGKHIEIAFDGVYKNSSVGQMENN